MWKSLQIANKKAFIRCSITPDQVQCVLHDVEHCWIAEQSPTELQQQVKVLNKRIKFDVETATETLQSAAPEQASWLESDVGDAAVPEQTLKLKYRVRGCPFNFEWRMRQQTAEQLKTLALQEICDTFQGLLQLVGELRETVRRKEDEIAQYKREGAVLRRTTVQTQSYNFEQLDERVAGVDTFAKLIQQLTEQQQTKLEEALNATEMTTAGLLLNKTPTKPKQTEADKMESPRYRKRKALQAEKMRLSRKLNARKRKIEYENSQSQHMTDSSQELARETNAADANTSAACAHETQVNAQVPTTKKQNCAVTKSNDKSTVESISDRLQAAGERNTRKSEHDISNIATEPAALFSDGDKKLKISTSLNVDINCSTIITCNNVNVRSPNSEMSTASSTVVARTSTSELGAYIDTLLIEFDEIDKRLKECLGHN